LENKKPLSIFYDEGLWLIVGRGKEFIPQFPQPMVISLQFVPSPIL
jgi:hypothetical protein